MARAIVIAIIGLVGGLYLAYMGLKDVTLGNASKKTPTTMTYQAFIDSPPAAGTVVELTDVFVMPNCVSDTDSNNQMTAAFTGIAPANDGIVLGAERAAAAGGNPGILAIAKPVEGAGEFNRIAQRPTVTGLVLPTSHRLDGELESLIAQSISGLDVDNAPRLRIALKDTTNTGYAKLGGGAALILLPLLNVFMTKKKEGASDAPAV